MSIVNAKLSSSNGEFAFLTGLCIADMEVNSTKLRWGANEPNWLDPWLGDLKRICEEARVNIHSTWEDRWPKGSCGDLNPCISRKRVDRSKLDSAPAIPEKQDEGN